MRPCPVCERNRREDLGAYQEGWNLYACACGMHYLDVAGMTQALLDGYYRADTSPDLQGPDSRFRLWYLAELVRNYNPSRALDIGGRWSPLREMVEIETLNAGEEMDGEYDLVILSHTLEHVYDVPGLMRSICDHMAKGGRLVIEGPLWDGYDDLKYDHHWQHINKFTARHYLKLLERHGFQPATGAVLPDFLEFKCYRAEGVYCARG